MVVFVLLIRHEPEDHLLDHGVHLIEGALLHGHVGHVLRQLGQGLGVPFRGNLLQEVHHLLLRVIQLQEGHDLWSGPLVLPLLV